MRYGLFFLFAFLIAVLSCERKPAPTDSEKRRTLLEFDFFPSKDYAEAVNLLPAYREALTSGDWKRATAVASNMLAKFTDRAELKQFLEKEFGKDYAYLR